jgi:hypothetical protein
MHELTLLHSSALDAFNKNQERMNNLIKPSILESMYKENIKLSSLLNSSSNNALIKQQEKFNSMFNSSVFDTLRKQQLQAQNLIPSSTLSKLQEANLRINKHLGSVFVNSFIKDENRLKHQLGLSALNSIKMSSAFLSNLDSIKSITESLNSHTIRPDILKNLDNSFYFNLVQELKQENITLEETVEIVQTTFSKKIENTPHTFISYEGMVQLLFAIMLLIYSEMSAFESEERINEKIEELETAVLVQLEKLIPANEQVVYYIVKRTVNLRAKKSTKSSIISVLYPNQHVELIKRDSKWIYVKYFDHIDGTEKMGWVYKKYLKLDK